MSQTTELTKLHEAVELVRFAKRRDAPAWLRAWRAREKWDARWRRTLAHYMLDQRSGVNVHKLAATGRGAWGAGLLRKAASVPNPEMVADELRTAVDQEQFVNGALAVYLGLSLDEGEDAGQFTLDALGLDETFSWATQRDFVRDPFSVRGSKILQQVYGTHIDRLAKMVTEVCNPAQPKTVNELVKEIKTEWTDVTTRQARVIARSESAAVWETTNFNAMNLNQVQDVEWIVATGPAIGTKTFPVCERCLRRATLGPYALSDLDKIPPEHPNCRCTLVPKYDPEWLPPAEPWAGSETPLEVFT